MANEVRSGSVGLDESGSRKRLCQAAKRKKMKKKLRLEKVETCCRVRVKNIRGDGSDEQHSEDSNDPSENDDLIDDESSQQIDFDIEAFPMETGDQEGVVNMLTQIFLRADVDLEAFANSIIAQSPFGIVIGPAEDQNDEDNENVVYGVVTAYPLNNQGVDKPKFIKDVLDFLETKSRKFALKEFRDAFEIVKAKRTGLFINERMLNFPHQIVKPSFSSIRSDLSNLKRPYQRMVYIHKLRIADQETAVPAKGVHDNHVKKKKLGKEEKRRMAIHTLSTADIVFDNLEDEVLYKTDKGEAHFFDYPVHSEVESSSKFHILVKNGKSYKPYRRVVVMDMKRFNAFLEQVIDGFL